ncbi:cytochrome P450 [Paraphysoderma sedebokerense]|nr:cytochrome P450 [Paraphysoderma sedebokerense]
MNGGIAGPRTADFPLAIIFQPQVITFYTVTARMEAATSGSPLAILLNSWTIATAVVVVAFTHLYYKFRLPPNPHRPPGPKENAFAELRKYSQEGRFYKFAADLLRQYNSKIVCLKFMNRWIYVTSDADFAKEIYRQPERFQRTSAWQAATGEVGKLLFGMEGAEWKVHRKIIQPSFSPAHLRHSVPVIVEKSLLLFKHWAKDEKVEANVFFAFSALTLDILGGAFYSYDFKNLNRVIDPTIVETTGKLPLEHHINEVTKALQRRLTVPSTLPKFIRNYMLREGRERYAESISFIRKMSMQALEKKLKEHENQSREEKLEKVDMDLIDFLYTAMSEGKGNMTMKEISDEVLGFFLAGHETTANTLTFAIKALSDHPELITRLQEEIDQEITSDIPSVEDVNDALPRLKLLDAFIKELQRFYPVVPQMGREIMHHDTYLGEYLIPKHSVVLISMYALHFNEDYFEEPELFSIDRWLDSSASKRNPIYTFGDGPHRCIGEKLANLELKIILLLFLKLFTLGKIVKESPPRHEITLGYKNGLTVEIIRRNQI